ncbi:DNA modification methylase [Canibacter zhoujuaniae]|uniref:DNA modification methylase n=1 Tax=Canibacter zhoujuaniae TaxID=2708343 RepID=UPI0014211C40|nr:DNA modification methylase [Canibacter zhoujuaniae]
MKTSIVKSLGTAAVACVALTGCSLVAPVATQMSYNASDGVSVAADSVNVRNLLLVGDEKGVFNVVFTAVNNADSSALIHFDFLSTDGATAHAHFMVEPGTTRTGNLAEGDPVEVVELPGQAIGSTVQAVVTVNGVETELSVPVLDGTLPEYKPYIVTAEEAAKH